MYQINRRREIIKNFIYIFFILLLAVVSTYYIYNKFQGARNIDFNSESLDVTYHEKTGDKLTINRITPVTDSVGLSSKAYLITIKNNLTEKVGYKVKILDDVEKYAEDMCEENSISKDNIRISVKTNKKSNKIYCPEYCCLVPREINSLLTGQRVPKNHYRGVKRDYHDNLHPYTAYVYGGTFFTPWEAYLYYKQNKEAHIKEVAIKYYEKGQITEECFQGLINYEIDP